jgi:Tfp pilus assembly protein PilW
MRVSTSTARGLTFVEIMVASSLLALISLVSMSLLAVLQRSGITVAKNTNIGVDARRVLTEINRDLRQTGWAYDEPTNANFERGPSTATNPPGFTATVFGDTSLGALPALSFRKRTGFAGDLDADWNQWVVYQVVADGNFNNVQGTPARFSLTRRVATDTDNDGAITAGEPDITVTIAENLSRVAFARPDGGDAASLQDDLNIDLTLAITLSSPDGSGGAPPPGITVSYRERARMNNLPEDRN